MGQKTEENNKERKLRILVVDDDDLVIDFFVRFLAEIEGHEVAVSNDGEEALNVFTENQNFDLVITDLSMPKMDGIEFSVKIKRINPEIPIILCTGCGIEEKPDSVDVLLEKPIRINELRDVLKKLFG